MTENEYGARVERGKISEKSGGMYRVDSIEREGIRTPPIPLLELRDGDGMMVEYEVGDRVFFCAFADGDGLILGRYVEG